MLPNEPILFLALGAVIIWLIGVSFWLYRVSRHYARLVSKTGQTSLRQVLEKLLENQSEVEKHILKVEEALAELNRRTQKHVQKVGLVRFNPFAETGGDQSFALALLDSQDSGIVLLSLHGREGTRIYVKSVKQGKSKYQLSREEQQAIEEAKSQKTK